jgi:hypothetical protein
MTTRPYVHATRRLTARQGNIVRLDVSEDVASALWAAIQVAFDDPDSIPAEYADAADALIHAFSDIHLGVTT